MFVICKDGHLVYYWKMNAPIFLEKWSFLTSSRRQCLEYLQKCGHSRERAIYIVKSMQDSSETWISV